MHIYKQTQARPSQKEPGTFIQFNIDDGADSPAVVRSRQSPIYASCSRARGTEKASRLGPSHQTSLFYTTDVYISALEETPPRCRYIPAHHHATGRINLHTSLPSVRISRLTQHIHPPPVHSPTHQEQRKPTTSLEITLPRLNPFTVASFIFSTNQATCLRRCPFLYSTNQATCLHQHQHQIIHQKKTSRKNHKKKKHLALPSLQPIIVSSKRRPPPCSRAHSSPRNFHRAFRPLSLAKRNHNSIRSMIPLHKGDAGLWAIPRC